MKLVSTVAMQGSFHKHVADTMLMQDIIIEPVDGGIQMGAAESTEDLFDKHDFRTKYTHLFDGAKVRNPTNYTVTKAEFDTLWVSAGRVVEAAANPKAPILYLQFIETIVQLPEKWFSLVLKQTGANGSEKKAYDSQALHYNPTVKPYLVPMLARVTDDNLVDFDALRKLSEERLVFSLPDEALVTLVGYFTQKRDKEPPASPAGTAPVGNINRDRSAYVFEMCLPFFLDDMQHRANFIRCIMTGLRAKCFDVKAAGNYRMWVDSLIPYVQAGEKHNFDESLRAFCDFYFLNSAHIYFDNGVVAQNTQDEAYAKLVKGAMVNTTMSVVWTPADEMAHSKIDDESFTNVMWTYLQVILSLSLSLSSL
jgi:hypothetical protein